MIPPMSCTWRVVGDHRHERLERIFLFVEREHLLAGLRRAGGQAAARAWRCRRRARGRPRSIITIIGDVDQRRDRPLARRLQPALHPVGRRAVLQAADRAAEEGRAALGIVDADRNRAGEAALDLRHGERLERAHARRRRGRAAIPRTPMQSWRLGVTFTSNTGSSSPAYSVKARADRRIVRKLDDPAVIVAELELARRAHHAAAFDAADRRDLQRDVAAGDVGARRPEHADHARRGHWARRTPPGSSRPCRRRRVSTCSLSACGCFSAVSTLATRNGASASAGFDSSSTSSPIAGQLVGDRPAAEASVSRCSFSHDKRELHAPTPPESVGTSSARKP